MFMDLSHLDPGDHIPFSCLYCTYVFLEQLWFCAVHHVHSKHEAVGLEERAADVLVHEVLQAVGQVADPHVGTTAILQVLKYS